MADDRKPSLRERIQAATTTQELDELLQEGATYKFASSATQRRWRRAAQQRSQQLKKESK